MTMTHEERATRRKEIAEYTREHSVYEAAVHFGITLATAYTACREHNDPVSKMKADKRKEIAEYARDHGSKEACAKYRVGAPHVCLCLAQHGMRSLVKQHASANTYRTIALLQHGVRGSEIAKQLRVSRQRISQIKDLCETHGVILCPSVVPQKEGE